MPSPFPGMNPYLESPDVWSTFHTQAMTAMAERLAIQVRPDYVVHMEAHIWIHERVDDDLDDARSSRRLIGRADMAVVDQEWGSERQASRSEPGGSVLTAPARIAIPTVDIERQRYVEIRDRHNRALIAIVEILSPANKNPGPDRDQYLAKRAEILAGPAHFVEIDLLRTGTPMPDQDRPKSAYGIMVSRAEERPAAGFWPIGIRDPLPVIPVPLRPASHATLDLQEILHHVYDHGTYADEIYERKPEPRLDPSDQDWAQQLIPPRHPGRVGADES